MGAGGYFSVCRFQKCNAAMIPTARTGIDDPKPVLLHMAMLFVGVSEQDALGLHFSGIRQESSKIAFDSMEVSVGHHQLYAVDGITKDAGLMVSH